MQLELTLGRLSEDNDWDRVGVKGGRQMPSVGTAQYVLLSALLRPMMMMMWDDDIGRFSLDAVS
jgi:hypothetical protein